LSEASLSDICAEETIQVATPGQYSLDVEALLPFLSATEFTSNAFFAIDALIRGSRARETHSKVSLSFGRANRDGDAGTRGTSEENAPENAHLRLNPGRVHSSFPAYLLRMMTPFQKEVKLSLV
jgi:hypothetical protein